MKKKLKLACDALDTMLDAFDPNQTRDPHSGKWISGGASGAGLGSHVEEIKRQFGIDPSTDPKEILQRIYRFKNQGGDLSNTPALMNFMKSQVRWQAK